MAAPSVSGIAVPNTAAYREMANRVGGGYRFVGQPIRGSSGDGAPIRAGQQMAEIVLLTMTQLEWDWWATTILAGAHHAVVNAELWRDDRATPLVVSSARLHRPRVRNGFHGNMYHDVLILFEHVLPII